MRHYRLSYDYYELAEATIDPVKAGRTIEECVEFWTNWEGHVEDEDGDYTVVFLKNLIGFILREHRLPDQSDEGWPSLKGEYGITVKLFDTYSFDRDQFEVELLK